MRVVAKYSIEELAAKAGVSRRTVRYYVQRGLLPAPYGLGRGRHYGEEHLAALLQAKLFQERGLDLESIREALAGESEGACAPKCDTTESRPPLDRDDSPPWTSRPPGEGWFRQRVLPRYELHVGAGASPLSAVELAALSEFLGDLIERRGGG